MAAVAVAGTASARGELLRVLIVITRAEPGGAQVHVVDLVRGLRGHVEFHVAVGEDGFVGEELGLLGIPVHVVPELQRSISPFADLLGFRCIRKLITAVRPHLLHTHSAKAGVLGRLAGRAERVAAIHTAHAWPFSDGLPFRAKALAIPMEAIVGRWTRRLIVVSEADREVGMRYHVARAPQVRIVHNGVCDDAARAKPDAGGAPVVTMVARLAAPKDHHLLLRALAGVDAPFRLRLVGDGPDRSLLEASARDLHLADRVDFVGVSRDVPNLLASSHVCALISRQEGFPLAILEAMRAGLPVVASNVGGIKEAVVHGTTGILVPRGDESELRVALGRLIGDPALRRALGDAGRRSYESHFTADHMLAGTLAVYRELAVIERWPVPREYAA